MKTIPLTQGKVALVDDEDYERVNLYTWHAVPHGRCWYAIRNVRCDGKWTTTERLPRFILEAGDNPLVVDHINGDGLDNRRANLRLVSQAENTRNRYTHRAGKLPGTKHHPECKARPWEARIRIGDRTCYLGMFATEREAHERFIQADRERRQ